jgi:hypothetical protein
MQGPPTQVHETVYKIVFRLADDDELIAQRLPLLLIFLPRWVGNKRKIARGIASRAMAVDAKQTELCPYLSAIFLGGLLLNSLFGGGGPIRSPRL